jgi:radical SAM superfamily enzyme YgiQ (UPF0313 family)
MAADYICRGDGERVMADLLKRRAAAPEKGLLPVMPVMELDDLPMEDYGKEGKYSLSEEGRIVPLEGFQEYRNPRGDTKDSLFYVASRGCPHGCSFCAEPAFVQASETRPVRLKSVGRAIKDISLVKEEREQLKKVYFLDPDFFSKPAAWIEDFSREYRKRIALPFWAFGHPSTMSESKVSALAGAGLREVQIGVQSGSERTRNEDYRRKTSEKAIREAVEFCRRYGIYPWIDIIYNNPYETKEDLLQTISFLGSLQKPFELGSFGLEFLPGTPLYDRAREDGLLPSAEDGRNFHDRSVNIEENAYLNALIRAMAGPCTVKRLGKVTMKDLPTLTDKRVIDFMEKNPRFAKSIDALIRS